MSTDKCRQALADAAQSLESIAEQGGRSEYMGDMTEVRAYARSRAMVARAALAQLAFSAPVVLPDGSAFAVASFPLPKDHWLYAPRSEWDNERDEYAECPRPILNHHEHREAVIAAIRYAIRGATMCGQEMDFDPDALVQNACYALCGPFNSAAQPAEPAALSETELPQPQLLVEGAQGFVEGWTKSQVRSAINLALLKHRYSQPAEPAALTDEQIDDLAREMVKGGKSVNWLARAIERAIRGKA